MHRHDRMCSGILKHARVAIFTQPAPLAATEVTKHPRHVETNSESLSIGMSHVTILSATQVYRLFVMCQGIMNNRVDKLLTSKHIEYLTKISKQEDLGRTNSPTFLIYVIYLKYLNQI
jgi:hypothetical protein